MAFEEKRAWMMGLVTVVAYAVYVVVVLGRSAGIALVDVAYVAPLLWTIGCAIGTTIVLHVVLATFSPEDADVMDQRDREISRFGEHAGRSLVVVGGMAAFVMALVETPYFWIANVLYLAFALSAVAECVAKVAAYRKGFWPW
ncbi:hypothetical protein [Umezawaea sp. NPDC059074]|uniref:hypothetical protein n=1 Tax=Umezawaea sp. NPDC059074 TaxID=3346716 RepID=UPI0036738B1E